VNSDETTRLLDRMLRNEADMAAKRRVWTVIDYLAIEPGDRVLDCGCGLGWFVKILGALYPSPLYGCDSDVPRLAAAQREIGGRAGLSAADILSLPYPDAAFDKIVLSEVLEHLPDDAGGLAEVRRVLKPGGRVAITVPNHDYPFLWDPVNWVRERVGAKPIRSGFFGGLWTNHERLYTREQIVRLVERADLEVEDVRQFVHYCFPFAHNLVYGLGMRLVQAGLLSEADRFRYDRNTGSPWNPLNLARGLFNAIDRWNDPVSDEGRTTVILSVKARKRAA
jgi:SAM-dependent methyltransferase